MKVVIVGGNPAGLSAASAIRKAHPDWEIAVYEKDQYVSYGACGIPYYVATQVESIDKLITLTKETLETKRKIPVYLFHEVISVDYTGKTVTVKKINESKEFTTNYDRLLIATGAHAKIDPSFPSNHPRVFKVHTLNDAEALRSSLQTKSIKSVVIIGGGYIGLEMIESYLAHGIEGNNITLISPRLVFSSSMQNYIQKELELHGIRYVDDRVTGITIQSDEKLVIQLQKNLSIETDLVQISVGVEPATQIFRKKNLKMLHNGAILTDEYMRTSISDVYAAGDCIASYHKLMKKYVYLPLAPAANKQGRIAGAHIADEPVDGFSGVYGSAIFKVLNLYCALTGINESIAKELGYNAQEIIIENNEIAHYYPNAHKMAIRVIFDIESRLLLGAEIVAPSPMGAKKIDVFATALAGNMKIDDIQKLDLAYAPPFAPVWDPILISANVARKKCQ